MATFKADQLREFVRSVVRKEIKETVASAISEVLSERYLRKLAESAVGARPRGVADLSIMGDDEEPDEEVPHALANTIQGAGQEHPRFQKEPNGNHVRQHNEEFQHNPMLSLFFEGTKPLNVVEREAGMAAEADSEGVQMPPEWTGASDDVEPEPERRPARQEPTGRRPMNEVWSTLAGVKKVPQAQSETVDVDTRQKLEEDRLKRMREQLEVKVGG
jgi:hypothetical protein